MALRVVRTYICSTELLKRLNSDEEPLTKRLKLAENTLHATDIPIVRKDDFILQWLCNTYPMDQEVWDTLNNYNLSTIFIHSILYPLCAIIDHNCTDSTNRLGIISHMCIKQLILGRKHVQNREFLKDKDIIRLKNLLSILTENAKAKNFQKKSTLEYKNLLISILDASVYLRQEEKLISSILIALKGSLHQIRIIEANTFFPHEFKEKLMNVVSNVTNSQSIIMLRTLVYYLKTDCLEMLHSNVTYKNILIFQASVELLTTLLDGICIFEYSGAFVSYKKFMNTFTDLKNVLSLLMDKILFLNYDEQIFNKLILQQTTIFQNISSESSIIFKNLIGGLEYCWSNILKFDTGVISTLSNEQVSNLTYLLLTDMTSNVNNFNEWVKVLHKDNLQENKRLIVFLLSHIFAQIGHLATGVTKLIAKHFNAKFLVETEIVEDENINKILISIKEELLVNKWIQIQDTFLCKIKVHLEVLLHLPLMFLSTNLSLITFMFIFALRMETDQNNEIVFLCNTIFLDLLERSSIDVFQYINPSLLLQQLPHNKIIQKTLELFLRSCSYAVLKELIKSSADSNKNIMVTNLPSKLTKAEDVKILNLVLRISITNENINEKLKDVAESTILNIFVDDRNENTANELLEDSLQLVVVILHNKKIFQITNQSMRGIWYTLFKYPCIDVLLPLLGSSEPKELYEFLEQLHNQLIKTLLKVQENDLENICIIWNTILKTNMSNDRNKLRLTAINNLIQIIQTVKVPEKFWPNLLKLIQNILVTKHLYLPDYIIDMNRIPALLILYRRILSVVVHKSKDITNKSEEHTIKCLMLDIEKFTSSLIKLKKDMIRISPYLVADLLELFSENLITSFAKASLQNCINQMISICDQHGIALLSRTLPVSMQEIFKTQLDIYNKFYKFSGKI
ncbi:hypothetical protein WH47_03485 [Habropoda laboriosa]|uniref:Nucleolar 27S pre-rRNA processing Urb2/Npa2 C-terminal domain-containing protein n=1 Tax=Habropoda laboriosa TaxID=597456 RepID=A0A0L7RBL8_9HYME|nr:hypothetical protein WH47_03485 [Habropoda laboriosa]